jgi:hypothetical protein
MVDFQKAFLKGIEAHDEASRARREISSVLDEFARQIHAASGAKVQIRRDASQRADKARRALPPPPEPATGTASEAVSYGTLYAGAPYGERYELCTYQLSRLGYPISISFSGNDYRCQDRTSLEDCLSDLLQDPLTGGKLRRLMGSEGTGGSDSPQDVQDVQDAQEAPPPAEASGGSASSAS